MAHQKFFSPEILVEFVTNFEQNELDVCIIRFYFVIEVFVQPSCEVSRLESTEILRLKY